MRLANEMSSVKRLSCPCQIGPDTIGRFAGANAPGCDASNNLQVFGSLQEMLLLCGVRLVYDLLQVLFFGLGLSRRNESLSVP